MKNFYTDTARIYDEGFGPNIYPTDGRKYYEDKVGVRIKNKGEYHFDWWIQPQYNKITIEFLSVRTIFICESINDDNIDNILYSIILDDQDVLFDNISGVQRIEGTDMLIINDGETNSIIQFFENGTYEIRKTSFHRIFKLHDKLINHISIILGEKVAYLGIVKQSSDLNHITHDYQYFFLDINFIINKNLKYKYSTSPFIYYHSKRIEISLLFKHIEKDFKFLYIPERGIISKKLSTEVEYLGEGLYKIRSIDNSWDIIDLFGSEYLTALDCMELSCGDFATSVIFCKNGQYGAMDISGEIFNIPLGDKLVPHQNSYGAKSGYVRRNSSVFDILGNSYEVSFPSHLGSAVSEFKPIIDDNCFSKAIGGGLYSMVLSAFNANDNISDYSYVVNRLGEIIKEKREGHYCQFFDGLFVFRTNIGIYQVINKEDIVIFSSESKIRIIEVPNNPIIAVEKKETTTYHSKKSLEFYNKKGKRIFESIQNICDAKPFSRGNILLGIKSEATYSYHVTVPLFDRDEDGNSYCKEYHTYDIDSNDITLWGLYDANGNEILSREYYDIEEDNTFNLIKLSKICGEARRGFFQIYGYSDYMGTILLEPSYESIEIFTNSLIRVKVGKRYGLLDFAFKQVIPCRYETLEILDDGNIHNTFKKKKNFPYFKTENGLLSPTGLLICQSGKARILLPRRICKVSDFKNGIALICNDSESRLKYGLVNHYGEVIVEDKYLKISSITDKIYKCKNMYGAEREFDLYIITKDYTATLIGSFDFVSSPSDNSIGVGKRLKSTKQDTTYGIIDLEGRFILDICSSTLGKELGEYRTITVANKMGFVHTKTKRVVLIADANFIGPLHNGIASFAIGSEIDRRTNKIKGGKWGVVNKYGEEIINPIYSKIFTDKWSRIYFSKESSKIGMIDKDERVIISNEYDFLHNDTNENQIVLAKKSGIHKGTLYFFNNNGVLQNSEEYDENEDW